MSKSNHIGFCSGTSDTSSVWNDPSAEAPRVIEPRRTTPGPEVQRQTWLAILWTAMCAPAFWVPLALASLTIVILAGWSWAVVWGAIIALAAWVIWVLWKSPSRSWAGAWSGMWMLVIGLGWWTSW